VTERVTTTTQQCWRWPSRAGQDAQHQPLAPSAGDTYCLGFWSGTGPVAQPVFKTGPVWQPHACSVRLRGRSVSRNPSAMRGFVHWCAATLLRCDPLSPLWLVELSATRLWVAVLSAMPITLLLLFAGVSGDGVAGCACACDESEGVIVAVSAFLPHPELVDEHAH
jgi:hypothetical protein